MNFMEIATLLAFKAEKKEEIPVGAVIVKGNKIIAKAKNTREKSQVATHHAELLAIEKACKKLKSWRLDDCDLYVTLEPCPMCMGAIMNARIKNLHFAVKDEANGGISKFNITQCMNHSINHFFENEFEEVNKNLIKTFFASRRKK